jgi:hypothetical protein
MISRRFGLKIENQSTLHVYEHFEHFQDCLVSLIGKDKSPLPLYLPVYFDEVFEDDIIHTKDLRGINNVLYTLKTEKNIECEAVYDDTFKHWAVTEKIKDWELCPFKGHNSQWLSPCKDFLIECLNYKIGNYFEIRTLDGIRLFKNDDINKVLDYYNKLSLMSTRELIKTFKNE